MTKLPNELSGVALKNVSCSCAVYVQGLPYPCTLNQAVRWQGNSRRLDNSYDDIRYVILVTSSKSQFYANITGNIICISFSDESLVNIPKYVASISKNVP